MYLLVSGVASIVLLVLAIRFVTGMPGCSYRGVLPRLRAVEEEVRERIERHVRVLAGEIGERNLWHYSALEAAARYVECCMVEAGYEVRKQGYEVRGRYVENLDAELPGQEHADEIVLVGAHYDSVVGSPGANDNATGVAAVLELARLLAGQSQSRTVRFAAFVNEEPPFCFTRSMGSRVYARRSRLSGEQVVAMLSLETIGYYSDAAKSQRYPFPFALFYPKVGNFIGFVGNLSSRALVRQCVGAFRRATQFPSEGVAAPGYLPGIFWSDHWSFWRAGYRAVMVTDTAPFRYPYYHTSEDTSEKVDYERTARVAVGLAEVVARLAERGIR